MAKLTPEEFQEKHARRLSGALEDIRRGVENVTVNPMEKAVKAIPKMRQGFLNSIDSGKVEAGFKRVTLEAWKRDMLEKGVDRIPVGIEKAKDKVIAFASQLLPHIDTGLTELSKKPDVTLSDSKNRVLFWIDHMVKFKRVK